MIVGVTGDTHNNLKNIKEICSIFNENRTDLVFHTGDISLPKSLLAFKDRSKASKTAPPNGLFLVGVRYEASIHIDIPELVWPHFLGLQR